MLAEPPETLDNSAKSGIMESRNSVPLHISMQFFGTPNFDIQTTAGVRKTIRSLSERIEEHHKKISLPESFYPEWDAFSEREKDGYRNHWMKEIQNFENQIEQAKEELRKRGETP